MRTVRVAASMASGTLTALLVAALEARHATLGQGGGADSTTSPAAFFYVWAALAPLALGCSFAMGMLSLVLDPEGPTSPEAVLARLRRVPVFERSRHAALAPLICLTAFAVVVALGHIAVPLLSNGTPNEAGAALALAALAVSFVFGAMAFALASPLRRLLAFAGTSVKSFLDPPTTTAVALATITLLFAYGIQTGDTSGGGGLFGVFGVLRRKELDLTPLGHLAAIGAAAFFLPLVTPQPDRRGAFVVALFALISLGITGYSAKHLSFPMARLIERDAPLAKIGLALLRKTTDRDRDGASGLFAGGDCNDHDPRISPNAIDIPGNGIDEDCSGADTPLPHEAPTKPKATEDSPRPAIRPDLNIILITIDTLRADLGFSGYDQPVTPELDKFAAKSAIFERMYSLASYTGKSIGPMMIGKYPSETLRDGNHFNTYLAGNRFVAERMHDAGFATIGANSLWYLSSWSGVSQGFDIWDTSATPPGGGDKDNFVTADKVTAVAQKLLAREPLAHSRFFAWFHYFDPHAEYMPHKDAPDFRGAANPARSSYDGEVWFTDSEVGKLLAFIGSQPYADRTAIIITADHGEAFGEHGMSFHGRELWEPLVRVPFLVAVPGQMPRKIALKRSQIDLVPTILELAHVAAEPVELRGESLVSEVFGSVPEERDVYIDMPLGPFNAVRHALIAGETPGKKLLHLGGKQYQLFDLTSDPGEAHDLARDETALKLMVDAMVEKRGSLHEIEVKPVGGEP